MKAGTQTQATAERIAPSFFLARYPASSPFLEIDIRVALAMLPAALARRTVPGLAANARRSLSSWSSVPAGPPDPILGS